MKDTVKPLGTLIDDLNKIREKRRILAGQDKKLEEDYKDLESQIDARMTSEGMEKATGKTATVSFSPVVVANIVDWDAVCKYIKRTGNFQLFQHRISDPAFRELLETKKAAIPGLEAFEKRKLNLRTL